MDPQTNSIGQVVEKSFDFVLCLFNFVEGKKNLEIEYRANVWIVFKMICLPCQISSSPKWAKDGFRALVKDFELKMLYL